MSLDTTRELYRVLCASADNKRAANENVRSRIALVSPAPITTGQIQM